MSNSQLYSLASILVLAALLFYPVNKMIWVLGVRRLQKKLNRELTRQEMNGQLVRARFITFFVVLIFSFLFNMNLLGSMYE